MIDKDEIEITAALLVIGEYFIKIGCWIKKKALELKQRQSQKP